MKKIKLEQIIIKEYADSLRAGKASEYLEAINNALAEAIGGAGTGFNLALFMLEKDLLIFQCKFRIAYFDGDQKKMEFFQKKIEETQKELEKKATKREASNPYKSFLAWLQSIEKYFGFSIDKNNDLLYLVEATKRMLADYENQKRQLEEQQSKSKRK